MCARNEKIDLLPAIVIPLFLTTMTLTGLLIFIFLMPTGIVGSMLLRHSEIVLTDFVSSKIGVESFAYLSTSNSLESSLAEAFRVSTLSIM